MFEVKARCQSWSKEPARWLTKVGSGLTCKQYIWLERLARYKHWSLLRKWINYDRKKLYNIGPGLWVVSRPGCVASWLVWAWDWCLEIRWVSVSRNPIFNWTRLHLRFDYIIFATGINTLSYTHLKRNLSIRLQWNSTFLHFDWL